MNFSSYLLNTSTSHPPKNPLIHYIRPDAEPTWLREYAQRVKNYAANLKVYAESLRVRVDEQQKAMNRFKQDALTEVGLQDHPQAEKIWQYVCNREEVNSMQEIMTELESRVEFLSLIEVIPEKKTSS